MFEVGRLYGESAPTRRSAVPFGDDPFWGVRRDALVVSLSREALYLESPAGALQCARQPLQKSDRQATYRWRMAW
jgi:hypothetical protein